MKHILSVISLSIAVGLTAASRTPEAGHNAARSPETCGDPSDAQPFYRSYQPTQVDHYYTYDPNLINTAVKINNYSLEEVAAFVFLTQEDSTVPFYHLHSKTATDNFYTISTTERDNAINDGYIIIATDPFTFIYPTQVCGSVPF
ncbi:hypothetical protein B0H14DRAFT_1680317 [Mycena olivaceomarginata]|nr:hypothetical protein B0H14DRAFT_1680317 [Mycena olivaceomarginata]